MAEHARILIVGMGVFGRLLAAELLRTTTADLVLAGRHVSGVVDVADALGAPARVSTTIVDLDDPGSLADAADGSVAVACTAGPFQLLPTDLPAAAVRAKAHWVDISDDRDWVMSHLRDAELDAAARSAAVAVMPGLSTVPALSGALARMARHRIPSATRSRVILFIGNRNAKGAGAIQSALDGGLRHPVHVDLPPPLGRRPGYLGHSADTELFRDDLALQTEFRVVLEWGPAARFVSGLGRIWSFLGEGPGSLLARALAATSVPFGSFGTRGGCLQVELWDDEQRVSVAAVSADQRLAIVPCAMALERIVSGDVHASGVVHPVAWLPQEAWLDGIRRRGVTVVHRRDPSPAASPSPTDR
jgi:hypothetical protein